MHVLYASDENYIRHAAASMLSLLDSNRDVPSLTVHFLSMGVTEESRQAVRDLAAPFGREVCFYELGDLRRWFDFSFDARGFAQSTLARLFMARVLPETVDRVIYIDCDTVVLDSLQEMFDTPMGHHYLGMVAEPTANKPRRVQLGMPDQQPYFNAGILLVNLKLWREENAENTVLCYYRDKGGNLIAPDQDAINGAFVGRTQFAIGADVSTYVITNGKMECKMFDGSEMTLELTDEIPTADMEIEPAAEVLHGDDLEVTLDWLGKPAAELSLSAETVSTQYEVETVFNADAVTGTLWVEAGRVQDMHLYLDSIGYEELRDWMIERFGEPTEEGEEPYAAANGGAVSFAWFRHPSGTLCLRAGSENDYLEIIART